MRLLRFLVIFTILLSPFLTCDPQEGVTYYELRNLPWVQAGTVVKGPLKAGSTALWFDVAQTPANTTTKLDVRACSELWGCSEPAFFDLKRPAKQSLPAVFKLERGD